MANTKSSGSQKPALKVGRNTSTGQFIGVREAKSRPGSVVIERIITRDAKTGSFTTRRSTTTIQSNVDQFTPALKRLAKK
jgi:hypothetical protein